VYTCCCPLIVGSFLSLKSWTISRKQETPQNPLIIMTLNAKKEIIDEIGISRDRVNKIKIAE
jgi:hypothetical protein